MDESDAAQRRPEPSGFPERRVFGERATLRLGIASDPYLAKKLLVAELRDSQGEKNEKKTKTKHQLQPELFSGGFACFRRPRGHDRYAQEANDWAESLATNSTSITAKRGFFFFFS